MNTIGNNIRISIFGESHGASVGCVIDGLPAGFKPDFDFIRLELLRRSPSSRVESTGRKETDDFELLSGIYRESLTGAPLTAVFRNNDASPADYPDGFARPSHADYAAFKKYGGFNDPRGGGAFSGRLTLPIVFAGALAKQLLLERGIRIASHIKSVGKILDTSFDPIMTALPELDPFFPLIDTSKRTEIDALFTDLRSAGDSVGGVVECAAIGLPAGIGEPFFYSIESVISHILFSIPAVHGVEFGAGFALSSMTGRAANDAFTLGGKTLTNNSGGINGGISNGMPLIMRAAFRPVPSIGLEQVGYDLDNDVPKTAALNGRHDACILPRGCVIVEAAAAIGLLDLIGFEKRR